jgi:hypothetical protein
VAFKVVRSVGRSVGYRTGLFLVSVRKASFKVTKDSELGCLNITTPLVQEGGALRMGRYSLSSRCRDTQHWLLFLLVPARRLSLALAFLSSSAPIVGSMFDESGVRFPPISCYPSCIGNKNSVVVVVAVSFFVMYDMDITVQCVPYSSYLQRRITCNTQLRFQSGTAFGVSSCCCCCCGGCSAASFS